MTRHRKTSDEKGSEDNFLSVGAIEALSVTTIPERTRRDENEFFTDGFVSIEPRFELDLRVAPDVNWQHRLAMARRCA